MDKCERIPNNTRRDAPPSRRRGIMPLSLMCFLRRTAGKRGRWVTLQRTYLTNTPSARRSRSASVVISHVDSTSPGQDGVKMVLCLCAPPPPRPCCPVYHEKTQQTYQTWHTYKISDQQSSNCRDDQTQGKSPKQSEPGREPKETRHLSDIVSWMGFWGRKRPLAKN